MLLLITSTTPPATDLGYLLYKNPARVQTFDLPFGCATVFYPEAREERCTAALLLEVDPIGLVRKRRGPPGEGRSLEEYVNDRPYVASSFLSVAIARVYGSALSGRSRERPDLAETPLPYEARIPVLPCRGGEGFLRQLFEPLGYEIEARRHALDERFPEWGESPYFAVALRAQRRLAEILNHLYVLIPVMDDEKHYWVGEDEIEKLLRHTEGWLADHPLRDAIARRYLKHQRRLTRIALRRLLDEDQADPDAADSARAHEEQAIEAPIRLQECRVAAVVAELSRAGVRRIVDLGCGEGHLLRALLRDRAFAEILGMDVSPRALEIAASRLRLARMPERERERIRLIQGSLLYRDARIAGFDAATCIEVIEHLDPPRLAAFERVVFEFARPAMAIVTTPNREYNATFKNMPKSGLRHRDHRFEWTRDEFGSWARGIAERFRYEVRFNPVGPEDPALGAPTQMAVFARVGGEGSR